jgi:DNA-binding XRE family transcriptional regulator
MPNGSTELNACYNIPEPKVELNPAVMPTGAQIRAARAMLGWSAMALAAAAGVSHPTVARAERTEGVPRMRTENLVAIAQALQEAGVVFMDAGQSSLGGGVGVRLAK